jgi:ADP-ribose pyrophosphatase YjhB (NUDIX family)
MTDPQLAPASHCLRCGSLLAPRFVMGRERLKCPQCGWVLFRDPKVACAVVIARAGRVLLVQRNHNPGKGLWCLPAGFEDAEEPPEATARREALEETGLNVTLGALLGVYYYDDDPRGPGVLIAYIATIAANDEPTVSDETSAVGFFAPDALPPLSAPVHGRVIADWLTRDKVTN